MSLLQIINSPWVIMPGKLDEISAFYTSRLAGEKVPKDVLNEFKALNDRLRQTRQEQQTRLPDGVAIVSIEGVIAPKANMITDFSGGCSCDVIRRDLNAALADENVIDIMLHIDSPGGNIAGIFETANLIFNARKIKNIVAFTDNMMCSGAAWIAAAASHSFISSPTDMSGSVGVIVHRVDVSKANEKDGVTIEVITAGDLKAAFAADAPMTQEFRSHIQTQVDGLRETFTEEVARFRGLAVEKVREDISTGAVFIGQEGIDVGLIDGIKSFDEIMEMFETGGFNNDNGRGVMSGKKGPDGGAGAEGPVFVGDQIAEVTVESIRSKYPQIYAAIVEIGAENEQTRVFEVKEQSVPGYESVIEEAVKDRNATGASTAKAMVRAMQQDKKVEGNERRTELKKDQVPSMDTEVDFNSAPPKGPEFKTKEEKWKHEFETDLKISKKFGDANSYIGEMQYQESQEGKQ